MQNPSSQSWLTGIDVSSYQGQINWDSVKTDSKNIKFAYLRAYGSNHTTLDTQIVRNASEAKRVGIPTGSYFYSVPKYKAGTTEPDLVQARSQADLFIAGLQQAYGAGNYGELMPMLDLEDSSSYGDVLKMTVDQMLDWAYEFRRYFEETTGVKLGLYAGHYFVHDQRAGFNEGITARGNILKDMVVWLAGYEDQYPAAYGTGLADTGGWTEWQIHQYSQQGTIAGITGSVDMDRTADVSLFETKGYIPPSLASPAGGTTLVGQFTITNVNDGVNGGQGAAGPQGVIGPKGIDGSSLFTWIKYSDTPTSGMADIPDGKKYMGISYNKSVPDESTNYSDYQWALIEGPQGAKGIDGVTRYTWIQYGDDSVGTGISNSPAGKKYMGISYNNASDIESTNPADYTWSLIVGDAGPKGDTGLKGDAGAAGAAGAAGVAGRDGITNLVRKVRYIRDWVKGSSVNAGNHWVELKAMSGTLNRAAGLTPTSNGPIAAETVYTNGNTASADMVYNNNGMGVDAQYLQLDLGAIYEDLDFLQIWHYWSDGRIYHNTKVEVSEDAVTWVTVFDSARTGEYKETDKGLTVLMSARAVTELKAQVESKVAAIDYNGNQIASLINQSATTVTIEANKINLLGKVTLESLDTPTQTKVNDGATAKSTVDTNKVTWDRALNINADGKFDAAKLNGTLADSQLASALKWNNAESTLNSWKSGTTLINGGMIATNTIIANQIAIGDFANLATVNENLPQTMLTVFGGTKVLTGYIAPTADTQDNTMVTDYLPNPFIVNDEIYFEFEGYVSAAATVTFNVFTYNASKGWLSTTSFNVAMTTTNAKYTGSLKLTNTQFATAAYVVLGFGTLNKGFRAKKVKVFRKNKGTLLVDGSIVASHIQSLNGLNAANGNFVIAANGDVTLKGTLNGATGSFTGDLTTKKLIVDTDDTAQTMLLFRHTTSEMSNKIASFEGELNICRAGLNNTLGQITKVNIMAVTAEFDGDVSIPTGKLTVPDGINQETMKVATLAGAWVNYGGSYRQAAYWKDKNGVVHLTGLIKTGAAGSTIFTLPAGYRPWETEIFLASHGTAGSTTRIDIKADGTVVHNGTYTTFLSLSGISFRAEN